VKKDNGIFFYAEASFSLPCIIFPFNGSPLRRRYQPGKSCPKMLIDFFGGSLWMFRKIWQRAGIPNIGEFVAAISSDCMLLSIPQTAFDSGRRRGAD
jgi:hypothetical protein